MTLPIAQLIHEPESKTLEFKRDLSSPRSWLKTLVTFANSAGGRLVFGVTDDRKVVGVENPLDKELELIEQWGSGIPGIFRKVKAEKLPEPTIEDLAGRVRFTIPLPEILPLTSEQ